MKFREESNAKDALISLKSMGLFLSQEQHLQLRTLQTIFDKQISANAFIKPTLNDDIFKIVYITMSTISFTVLACLKVKSVRITDSAGMSALIKIL